jgi:phthalate 4,5-dioxygenase
MLAPDNNARLTRVGPATPMGDLFRRFWLPALLAAELAEPDGPPHRLRLLGELLVAFRDSTGRVGILGEHCPHRGASLFFGRNEQSGLRCVYHGWKFDADGQTVDMPNEPTESDFKHKVQHTSYPAVERGGFIWVYMGPPALRPELPDLEWIAVPDDRRHVFKWFQDSNYLQALEGEIDSSHLSFLHSWLNPNQAANAANRRAELRDRDKAPRLSVQETDYGFVYGARRTVGDGTYYWRVAHWLLPTFTLVAGDWPRGGRCFVPIDDEHTWVFSYRYRPDRAFSEPEVASLPIYVPPVDAAYRPTGNRANDYKLDRHIQRTLNYTGIRGVNDEDRAMTEGMGAIFDRSHEHLGTSDLAVIAMRRTLLRLVEHLGAGAEPVAPTQPSLYAVRALDLVAPQADFGALLNDNQPDLAAVGTRD